MAILNTKTGKIVKINSYNSIDYIDNNLAPKIIYIQRTLWIPISYESESEAVADADTE